MLAHGAAERETGGDEFHHTGCRSEGVYDPTQIVAIRRVSYFIHSYPLAPLSPRQLHMYAPYPLVACTPLIHVHPLAPLYSRNRRARTHARPLSGHPSPTPPPPPSALAPALLHALLPAFLIILLPLPFLRSLHSAIELCPPYSRLAPPPSSPFTLTIPASTCKIR
jgi:hypothetical protein